MTTIRNFCSKYKLDIFITAILIAAGVFAVLGREAAFYYSMTDILLFCSEASRVIVGSLMFPLGTLVLYISVKDVRKKLLSVVCAKLITEIMFIPFGINLNFFSDVFFSDLSGLFFIAADSILMISLWSEKDEKTVCGGVLSAVTVISLFTVAISSRNGDATIYVYRTLSTVLFYISVFYSSLKLPEERAYKGVRAELKYRVKKEKEKSKLVTLLFLTAVCACTTTFFVVMSIKNIYVPNEKVVELTCYISWCALFLFVSRRIASHVNNFTTAKSIATALCVAAVSTLQVVILNSYGHLLEYFYWFGNEVAFRYSEFFIGDLTYTIGYGWLRYPAVFMTVFTASMLIFMLIKKSTDNNPLKAPDNIKPFPFDNDEDFAFVESEGKIITVDFENKTPSKSLADELFGGDSFTMDDNKDYDILFTFDNEEETEKYVVYTDNSLDDEGKIQIFASKYNPDINAEKLLPVESDEEWEAIQYLLDYAMEKARENIEKSKEDQIELDTYKTLTAMSEALAEQAFDNSPFILSIVNSEGKGKVSICGDNDTVLNLVKETLQAISLRLKADGLSEMKAFDLLGLMVAEATDKAYEDQRTKRKPFRGVVSDDETQKIDLDLLNSFLEGD